MDVFAVTGFGDENGPMEADVPPYLAGLRLERRRVVVVGGGPVAQRRVAGLAAAGADVVVVAPIVTATLEARSDITWLAERFAPLHLDGAWYAVAATDDAEVNAAVTAEAEARRIFCVRADLGRGGSAVTPATGTIDGLCLGVLAGGDPARSAAVRSEVIAALESGKLAGGRSTGPGTHRAAGVTLVGAGPGHPDLVTTGARAALASAEVVVADRLVPQSLLAELGDDVELIDVAKLPRGRAARQEEINAVLIERAQAGKRVVRLKGGDGFVFGRGFEEVEACVAAGVSVSVVPGVTSALSVPALAGIPATHRGVAHEFTVLSGHLPPGHPESLVNWPALAGLNGTLIVLMGVEQIGAIAAELMTRGKAAHTPVAVIENGGLPTQRVRRTELAHVAQCVTDEDIKPPAVFVIGPVAALG
ncbi:MAG: uroporphyrinogen-III C-methyltransferase [Nocardioides sp.]